MADMIARLKVDSSEYDAKIQRAAKGIQHLAEECHNTGSILNVLEDENREYIKSLGNMATVATTTRGKIAELTSGFIDIKSVYNSLSDEEKKGEFGKELNKQLDIMKGRITDAKKELADINKELEQTDTDGKNLGGVLDQLAGKFGISTKSLMGWGAAIGAGTAALKVAKDAFFASEQNIDDWARTTTIAKSAYEGFLTALNTGDISGYLNNISQITQAAAEAYNAIDRLQTMQNIQSPKVSAKQAEIQRFEAMLRTGRYIAPVDGRKAAMAEGTVLNDAQKKQIADNLASAMREIAVLTKNEVKASTDAINALYKEQALRLNMSNEEFKKGTASMAAFEANLEKARKYQEFEAQHTTRTQMNTAAGVVTQNVRDNVANPYEAYKNWAVFKDDGELYQRIIQLIQQRSSAESQYYGQVARAYRGINKVEGAGGGGGKTGKTGTTKPKDIIDEMFPQQEVVQEGKSIGEQIADGIMQGLSDKAYDADVQTLKTLMEVQLKNGIDGIDIAPDYIMEKLFEQGADIPDDYWRNIEKQLNEKLKEMKLNPINIDLTTGNLVTDSGKKGKNGGSTKIVEKNFSENVNKFVSGLDSVASGLNRVGVEIPKEVSDVINAIQAVSEIINGVSSIISAFQISAISANTAAVTANTIALVGNGASNTASGIAEAAGAAGAASWLGPVGMAVAAIPILGSLFDLFHNGGVVHAANGWSGIVPGNLMSGDHVPALLDSGEVVLNRAQTSALAADLQRNDQRGTTAQPYVSGEHIYLGLNNYLKSSGRGEIVTSRR